MSSDDLLTNAVSGKAYEWLSEVAPLLFAILLLLLLIQSVRLAVVRGAPSRRMARHRRLGAKGERRARALLHRLKYRLCEEQGSGSYTLWVDDQATAVHLRADYLVEKAGKRYIAEVKSGADSVKVTGRSTRRQLLEYLLAFDVDGVLLVDMHAERVHKVEFPELKNRR